MMTPEEAYAAWGSIPRPRPLATDYLLIWSPVVWDKMTPAQRAACEARWEELAQQITERKIGD